MNLLDDDKELNFIKRKKKCLTAESKTGHAKNKNNNSAQVLLITLQTIRVLTEERLEWI